VRRRIKPPARPASTPADDEYLADALAALSPKRRIVLVLRFYADTPDDEIAEILGVRPATVRSLAARGLSDLREVIER
jgi:RNA polymerase sigma factor (sigma-70 family)